MDSKSPRICFFGFVYNIRKFSAAVVDDDDGGGGGGGFERNFPANLIGL